VGQRYNLEESNHFANHDLFELLEIDETILVYKYEIKQWKMKRGRTVEMKRSSTRLSMKYSESDIVRNT